MSLAATAKTLAGAVPERKPAKAGSVRTCTSARFSFAEHQPTHYVPPRMPSQLHEVQVAMVRESEAMTRSIAEWATGEPMPADLQLRTRDQSYSEIQPPEYRADLVVEFVPNGFDKPTMMMIFEVQLTRDSDKRRTWPAYQAVLRAQYRCPAMVVVLAPDPGVARWCAEPIDLDGRGTCVMRPTVIPVL